MPNLVYYVNKRQKELVSLHQPSEEDILFGSIPKHVRDILRQLTATKADNLEETLFRVAKENHVQIDDILSYCEWLQAERDNGHGLALSPFSEIPEEIKETLKSLLRMNPTANETIRKIWASRFTSRCIVKQEVVLSYLRYLEEDGESGDGKGQSSLSDGSRRQGTRTTTAASRPTIQNSAFPGLMAQEQLWTHSSPTMQDGQDMARRSAMLVHTPEVRQHNYVSGKNGRNSGVASLHSAVPISTAPAVVHQSQSRARSLSPVRDEHDNARRSATLVNTPEVEQQNYITGNDEHNTGAARSRAKLPTPISVLSVRMGQAQSGTHSVSPLSPLADGRDNTRRSATLVRTPDVQHQTQIAGKDKDGVGIYNPITAMTEIQKHAILPETPHSLPNFETVFPVTPCNSRESLTPKQELLYPSGELRKPTKNVDYQRANVQTAITPEHGPRDEGHAQPHVPLMRMHEEDVTINERVETVGVREHSRWEKPTEPIRENPISVVRQEGVSSDMNGLKASAVGTTSEAAVATKPVIMNRSDSEPDTGDRERSELKGKNVNAPGRLEWSRDESEPSDPPQSRAIQVEARMDIDLEPVPRNMRELLAWIEEREGPLDNLLLIGELIKAGIKP